MVLLHGRVLILWKQRLQGPSIDLRWLHPHSVQHFHTPGFKSHTRQTTQTGPPHPFPKRQLPLLLNLRGSLAIKVQRTLQPSQPAPPAISHGLRPQARIERLPTPGSVATVARNGFTMHAPGSRTNKMSALLTSSIARIVSQFTGPRLSFGNQRAPGQQWTTLALMRA